MTTAVIKRTEEEIDEEINNASDQIEQGGTKWFGMTYEQGVDAALRWVLGHTDDKPMMDD